MVVAHVFMDTKKRQDYFFFLVTGTVKKPGENPGENLGENLVKNRESLGENPGENLGENRVKIG